MTYGAFALRVSHDCLIVTNAGELKEPRLGMSVFGYSDFLTNLFTRSSTIRKYFLFILSFRKLFPISFAASSGTSIYLSSTLLIRASVNPICAPNRSKSKRHGSVKQSFYCLRTIGVITFCQCRWTIFNFNHSLPP